LLILDLNQIYSYLSLCVKFPSHKQLNIGSRSPESKMSGGGPFQELFADQITQTKIPNLPSTTSPRKRKRSGASISEQQLRKRNHSTTENEEIDLTMGINRIFARMNNHLLADYVAQRTRKFEDDLSPVERDDRYIAGNYSMP
jgi:protein CMS1